MTDEDGVVVAAEPAVLADAIVELLRRRGVQGVRNATRDPDAAAGRYRVAVVSPAHAGDALADRVIVLPDAGSDITIDLTGDVIDLVAEAGD